MAITTYTRVLPNLNLATRREAYERLINLIPHLHSWGISLLEFKVDVPTRTVTITLTDPIPADNIAHLNLEGA